MGSGRLGDGFGDLLIKKPRRKRENDKKERKKERERENIHWKIEKHSLEKGQQIIGKRAHGPHGPLGPMGPWDCGMSFRGG